MSNKNGPINDEEIVAESCLIFLQPTNVQTTLERAVKAGTAVRVRMAIGKPSDEGYCNVYLEGFLPGRPKRISGTDTFHALSLAICFLRQMLTQLENDGWKFFIDSPEDDLDSEDTNELENDDCNLSVADLFGQLK